MQHVTRVAQKHCHCSDGKCEKLKVKKVGEGKYNIAGRNVFVRVCKYLVQTLGRLKYEHLTFV